jgi:hypothetical protein
MVEYVIKLEPSRYYFVPAHGLSRDGYLALGESGRSEGFNTMHGKPVRTYPVVEVSKVAAPVDLPLRGGRLDDFQIGKPEAWVSR